jgi:hypothetical protein
MADDTLWQTISNAGIRIRPDFTDSSRWVSATRWQQYGPFATREEAVGAAIRGLIAQLEATEQTVERSKRGEWIDRISSLFHLL